MSEASCTAFGRVERVYLLPLCLFIACNDELCDTVAVGDCKGFGREIDKNNTDFASIVGIDGAGRVEKGNAVFEGKARTWTHLCFVTIGQGYVKSCRDEGALHGLQGYIVVEVGSEIESCTLCCGISWQVVVRMIDDFYIHNNAKVVILR